MRSKFGFVGLLSVALAACGGGETPTEVPDLASVTVGGPTVDMAVSPDASDAVIVAGEHESCWNNGVEVASCVEGLTCVRDSTNHVGSCKQTCINDSVCRPGETCIPNVLVGGLGVCGYRVEVGGTCDNLYSGPRLCENDPSGPATCTTDSTCSLLCRDGSSTWACPDNFACVDTTDPNFALCAPAFCPLNQAASSQLGVVFTGDFLDRKNAVDGWACSAGNDAPYVWKAPVAGRYFFSVSSLGDYFESGATHTRTTNQAALEIFDSTTCMSGMTSLGCDQSYAASPLALDMTVGQEVLVTASRVVDTDHTHATYDITAPYAISVTACAPSCGNNVCGGDGCGGSCGTCGAGTTCSAGQCVCQPSCSGKSCGPDGCGGSCGTCFSGTCSAGGQCVCQSTCTGKTCGSDGCGGSCGSCSLGTSCNGSQCIADPDACDPVSDAGCQAPNQCILLSTEKTVCALAGSGHEGAYCSATVTCDGGYACLANVCHHVCLRSTGDGCTVGHTCIGVTGWATYGACQ
jgi:hypothetical protein